MPGPASGRRARAQIYDPGRSLLTKSISSQTVECKTRPGPEEEARVGGGARGAEIRSGRVPPPLGCELPAGSGVACESLAPHPGFCWRVWATLGWMIFRIPSC